MGYDSELVVKKLVSPPLRITWCHIIEPNAYEDQEPKYSVTLIVPKDHPFVAEYNKVRQELYEEIKSSTFPKTPSMDSAKIRNPLYDGDIYINGSDVDDPHPNATEFEGSYYLTLRNTKRPDIYNMNGTKMKDLNELYSGCYARVSMGMYGYNYKSMGFGFFLNAIKKEAEGEKLFQGFSTLGDFFTPEEIEEIKEREKEIQIQEDNAWASETVNDDLPF